MIRMETSVINPRNLEENLEINGSIMIVASENKSNMNSQVAGFIVWFYSDLSCWNALLSKFNYYVCN